MTLSVLLINLIHFLLKELLSINLAFLQIEVYESFFYLLVVLINHLNILAQGALQMSNPFLIISIQNR